MSSRPPISQKTLALAALLGLLLLTVAVYARGMNGAFQFDDKLSIQNNPGIRHLDQLLTLAWIRGAIQGGRVLTEITFALNYQAAGLAPFHYHVTNLVIHLTATLLVFCFTRRILRISGAGDRIFLALVVTAVFALHPLQTQAVIYLSQRAESLASAFYLASLLLLLRAEQRGLSAAGLAFYAAAFVLFALGLGSKVIVATHPVAYLLIGLAPGPQQQGLLARSWKRLALAVPFFVYALSTTFLTLSTIEVTDATRVDVGFSIPLLPPSRYFLTQWHVLVTYLRLLFWPAGQNPDWDFPLARGLGDPAVLLSGLFLAVLLGGVGILYLRHRARTDDVGSASRLAAFGVGWFFLLLLPTSSVIPLADVLMEHRIYLASWGVFLATAVLAAHQIQRLAGLARSRVIASILVCLFAGLAFATYVRVGVWRSTLALWSDCVAKSPRKARAHLGLANALRKGGDVERSIPEFHTALRLAKDDLRWIRQAIREDLTAALLSLGRVDEAVAELQAGLTEKPNDGVLLGLLAMARLRQHDLVAAETAAEDSVRFARQPAASLRILGMILLARGQQEGAIAAFEQAVAKEPDEAQGRLLLARTYRAQGRPAQACALLRGRFDDLQAQIDEARVGCPQP